MKGVVDGVLQFMPFQIQEFPDFFAISNLCCPHIDDLSPKPPYDLLIKGILAANTFKLQSFHKKS
jgi:hypothetical protein